MVSQRLAITEMPDIWNDKNAVKEMSLFTDATDPLSSSA